MLEDEVARLQAVIQEMENPASAAGNITLHNPYAPSSARSHGSGTSAPGISRAPSGVVGGDMPWWELDNPPRQITDML